MKIVRLNEHTWLDLWTLTRFVRSFPEGLDINEKPRMECHPQQGPQLRFSGNEAQAVVDALEASEVRAFPFSMLALGPHFEEPVADPDTPPPPTMADVAEEILSTLRKQAAARTEESRLNVIQRFRRFIFGGVR